MPVLDRRHESHTHASSKPKPPRVRTFSEPGVEARVDDGIEGAVTERQEVSRKLDALVPGW